MKQIEQLVHLWQNRRGSSADVRGVASPISPSWTRRSGSCRRQTLSCIRTSDLRTPTEYRVGRRRFAQHFGRHSRALRCELLARPGRAGFGGRARRDHSFRLPRSRATVRSAPSRGESLCTLWWDPHAPGRFGASKQCGDNIRCGSPDASSGNDVLCPENTLQEHSYRIAPRLHSFSPQELISAERFCSWADAFVSRLHVSEQPSPTSNWRGLTFRRRTKHATSHQRRDETMY